MGKRSYHESLCLQLSQYDLPQNDLLLTLLSAKALAKLPSNNPKSKPNPNINQVYINKYSYLHLLEVQYLISLIQIQPHILRHLFLHQSLLYLSVAETLVCPPKLTLPQPVPSVKRDPPWLLSIQPAAAPAHAMLAPAVVASWTATLIACCKFAKSVSLAASRPLLVNSNGLIISTTTAARIAIIAITTRSSTKVNPVIEDFLFKVKLWAASFFKLSHLLKTSILL